MSVHGRLGVAVIVVALIGAVLALVARRRSELVTTARVFVRLCAATAGVEAGIGLVMLATGERPAEAIHLFYGAATVVPIPVAELLARRVPRRDEMLYLVGGAVAMVLFGIRAVTTGNA